MSEYFRRMERLSRNFQLFTSFRNIQAIDRFHCYATTTTNNGNRPVEEAKKTKCHKRLIYKQFVQVSARSLWHKVSEVFAETFHATLQSFVWRRHIGAPFWCTNMAAGNQQKNLKITFSIKALSFHSRTSIRAHKHTF